MKAMKALKLATVFAAAISATGCALTDVKPGDTLETIGGTIIKNAGGQVQNWGTDKANQFKCENADNGIWVTNNSSNGGYSTNGRDYKGGAAGRTSGKCLTGAQKTNYLRTALRGEMQSAQATVRAKAQENKAICEMAITNRDQKRAVCTPLARDGQSLSQVINAQSSLEAIQEVESKFVTASDGLQNCLAEGKAPLKCYMDYNKQKM